MNLLQPKDVLLISVWSLVQKRILVKNHVFFLIERNPKHFIQLITHNLKEKFPGIWNSCYHLGRFLSVSPPRAHFSTCKNFSPRREWDWKRGVATVGTEMPMRATSFSYTKKLTRGQTTRTSPKSRISTYPETGLATGRRSNRSRELILREVENTLLV